MNYTTYKPKGYAPLYITVGRKVHGLLEGGLHSERRRENISLTECAQLKKFLPQFST